MTSYLRRLLRTGAAYQLADAVSKVVALALLPLYTRHLTRADYGTAELLLTTIILALDRPAARAGRGVRALPLPRRRPGPPARSSRGRRRARCSPSRPSRRCSIAVFAAPVEPPAAGYGAGRTWCAPAALGLWAFTNLELAYALLRVEERARDVRDRLADQRRASPSCSRSASWSAATRARSGSLLGNYVGLRGRAARPVVVRARRARARRRRRAARPDAALRAADRPRRGLRLRAVLRRPALALPLRERRPRPACTRSSVKLAGDRRLHRARVPVRVAAAGLLDRGRRRGRAASTPASRPTTCSSPGSSSPGLALLGPLARAALRRAGVLRRPRGAALGRARLGALRAVPGAGGDGRPRAGHGPQRARRAVRARRQRDRCWRCSCRRWASRAPGWRSWAPTP